MSKPSIARRSAEAASGRAALLIESDEMVADMDLVCLSPRKIIAENPRVWPNAVKIIDYL
jgi:hypothetical protein